MLNQRYELLSQKIAEQQRNQEAFKQAADAQAQQQRAYTDDRAQQLRADLDAHAQQLRADLDDRAQQQKKYTDV